MDGSTFVENKAGDDGPAVLSLGIAENVSNVTFDANTFYCSAGQYGYEMKRSTDDEVKCFPALWQSWGDNSLLVRRIALRTVYTA